jgi:hypothetical protein
VLVPTEVNQQRDERAWLDWLGSNRGGGGYYHCMTPVAGGKFIFGVKSPGSPGTEAAEKFRELMRKLAAFHVIEIITGR